MTIVDKRYLSGGVLALFIEQIFERLLDLSKPIQNTHTHTAQKLYKISNTCKRSLFHFKNVYYSHNDFKLK